MSKILISASNDNINKLNNVYSIRNYNNNYSTPHLFIRTFSKINICTKNSYICDEGAIFGVGTFIYQNKIDNEALKLIFDNFINVNEIRQKIIGSYCICIYKNGKSHIFVDDSNTYDIYYIINDKGELIGLTNCYYHLAKAFKLNDINENALIGEFLMRTLGRETIFKSIKKLLGDEEILIEENKSCVCKIGYSYNNKINNLANKIKKDYTSLPKVFKTSGVFITGGVDSRFALAMMLSVGMKPCLYYGIGNSNEASTNNNDFKIAKNIAHDFNLQLKTMNWGKSSTHNLKRYLEKYGELYSIYCANENFFNEFDSKHLDSDFISLGYFGESYRNNDAVKTFKSDLFTLDEFIDELYMGDLKNLFKQNYSEFHDFIYHIFEEECENLNLDVQKLKKADFEKMHSLYRRKWDTRMNNLVNLYVYSAPLAGKADYLNHALNLDYEEKYNSKYQMKLIYELEPRLLKIKFFSHIKKQKYYKKTFELKEKSVLSILKEKIRPYLKNASIRQAFRSAYYILIGNRKGLVENSTQYKDKDNYAAQIRNSVFNKTILDIDEVINFYDMSALKYLLLLNYALESILSNN